MTELKRCPICEGALNFDYEIHVFRCNKCGATVPRKYLNTRPIEDELIARITQLTAELAQWRADAERLATENAELHEQLRWRSVTEEPETGQWVFVSRGRSRFADIFIYDRKLSDSFRRYDLWLPIPPQQFGCFPDCPITLHRELVEKYGKEMK